MKLQKWMKVVLLASLVILPAVIQVGYSAGCEQSLEGCHTNAPDNYTAAHLFLQFMGGVAYVISLGGWLF